MDYSRYSANYQEPTEEENKTTPGSIFQTVLQNATKAGVGVADLIARFGNAVNPYQANPYAEKQRQNLSKEMGYAISGLNQLDKEKGMKEGIPKKVIQAASQMAVDIPAKYANPAWAGVMIGEGMLGGKDKGTTAEDFASKIERGQNINAPIADRGVLETAKDIAAGGGKGALNAAALKTIGAVSKLAPKGIARPLIEAAGMGGLAAAEGGDINDVISQAIIGGYFGFKGKDAPQKTVKDFKDYIRSAVGRDLKPVESKIVADKFKAETDKTGPTVSPENAPSNDTQAPEIVRPGASSQEKISVYHGTFADFQEFEPKMLGSNTGAPSAKEGFFFATNPKVAEGYASTERAKGMGLSNTVDGARKQIEQLTGDSVTGAEFKLVQEEINKTPAGYSPETKVKIRKLLDKINSAEGQLSDIDTMGGMEPVKKAAKGNIKEVSLDMKNPLIYDMGGREYRSEKYSEIIKKAKSAGNDGVVIKNTFDPGSQADGADAMTDIHIVFDKKQIKSTTEKNIILNEKPSAVPEIVKAAIDKPLVISEGASAQTKEESKQVINLGLKTGEIKPGTIGRGTTAEELGSIIKEGRLLTPREHGQTIGDSLDFISGQILEPGSVKTAYGRNDGISAWIIAPEGSADGKGIGPNEIYINPKTPLKDLRFIIDGHEKILTYDELVAIRNSKSAPVSEVEKSVVEQVPPATPPAPSAEATPYDPKYKTSGPALEAWKIAVKKDLADPENPAHLPVFETAEGQGFAERSVDFVNANPENAMAVLENPGKVNPPPGTNMGTIYVAMDHYVNNSGDVGLWRRFAEAQGAAKLSEAGSLLGSMGKYRDINTFTGAMHEIERTRQSSIKERKESPMAANVFDNRFNRTKTQLDASLAQHNAEITRLKAIYQRKKLDQYARKLGKKELSYAEKIKAGDLTKDPKYKTWLDQQTKGQVERVRQLKLTFDKLKEIADRRTTGVSDAEAQKIMDLYQDMQKKLGEVNQGRDRMVYGRAKVDFNEYVNDLKFRATKPTVGEALRMPLKTGAKIAGVSKAINAAFDNSYIFRQGFKTMWSHPGIWAKNATKSFTWAVQQFGGKHVMRELMADIVSRPNYMNGKMNAAKISFGNPEEPFPTSLPEKIWFFGKLYKASETAYAGQAYKNRADLFDKFMEVPQGDKKMIEVADKKQLESIGKLVNSLTGRGYIGKTTKEQADTINNVFFSMRFFKSNLDFLTAHQLQKGVTPFVRKEAAKNLIKAVAGTAAVLAVANALKPGSVEDDPRSASFGKIKIGNTRFDVTGGMGSIITLASRLLTNSTKSSVTGKIAKGGPGVLGDTSDYIYNFFEGKLSPAAGIVKSLIDRKDTRTRKPPVPLDMALRAFTPLPVQNAFELYQDPNSANMLLSMLADSLGIGVNTYGNGKKTETTDTESSTIDYSRYMAK